MAVAEIVAEANTAAGATGPLITIGISCFNEGDWLAECWDSVLAQTDARWTAVMVMDGGASEQTRAVFERIEHPRLRKFALPDNVGPYPARNLAFAKTETPYHFYLDGDDQLLPDSVALVLKCFKQYPSAGFVYGDYVLFGARDDTLRFPRAVKAYDFAENQPTPGACAYKIEVWKRLGGFADELARGNADYDFLIGAFEAGIEGRHCGRAFYRYRVSQGMRVSGSYKRRQHETREIMVRRHPRYFSDARVRRRFLSHGYYRSAVASHAAGELSTASRLALRASRLGLWRNRELQLIILEGFLPAWVYRRLKHGWRALHSPPSSHG